MDKKIISSKKIKIAFLSRYLGLVNRGAETYVIELSQRLAKHFQVDILKQQYAENFNLYIKGQYDLIIPTNGRLQSLKAGLGRMIGKYKTLISGQAGIGRDDIWNIMVTCPDVYVALTEQERFWAKHWAWHSQVEKIPNGVDLKKFSAYGPVIKIALPKPIILSVGALTWYKHHERIIAALAKLKQGSLLIVGHGPEKDKLQILGSNLLGKDRFQICEVSFSKMPEYYRSADLFTLPSWDREAFGIVYVEAMASNLPVVAPNDLARQEIVGEAGILVDTANIDLYAQAIKTALDQNWKRKPRKQAEKFSWDVVADQYQALIKKLCQ